MPSSNPSDQTPLTDPVEPDDVTADPVAVSAEPDPGVPVQNTDEIAQLRAEIAEMRKREEARAYADAVALGQPIEHPNTHVLVLANGKTVETLHPSTTHVSFADDDGKETVVPVTGRYEIHPT